MNDLELKEQNEMLINDSIEIVEELNELKKKYKIMTSKCGAQATNKEKNKKMVDEHKKIIESQGKMIELLKEQNEELKKEMSIYVGENRSLHQQHYKEIHEIGELKEENKELKEEIKRLQEHNEEEDEKLEQFDSMLHDYGLMEDENTEVKEENDDLKVEIDELKQENEKLKEKMEKRRIRNCERMEELVKALSPWKKKWEDHKRILEAIGELKEENKELKEEIEKKNQYWMCYVKYMDPGADMDYPDKDHVEKWCGDDENLKKYLNKHYYNDEDEDEDELKEEMEEINEKYNKKLKHFQVSIEDKEEKLEEFYKVDFKEELPKKAQDMYDPCGACGLWTDRDNLEWEEDNSKVDDSANCYVCRKCSEEDDEDEE